MAHIAIIGAGQAGAVAGRKLRQLGYQGEITLFGEERHLPYERPPLTKQGQDAATSPVPKKLFDASFYSDHRITLKLQHRVEYIDGNEQTLRWRSPEATENQPWDHLILATGARARPLKFRSFESAPNLHYVRSVEDAQRLKDAMIAGRKLLVIGGGYIGLEIASTARSAGLEVTVIEAGIRILGRVASPRLSDLTRKWIADHGVDLTERQKVIDLVGSRTIEGAKLGNGRAVECDLVVAGIGAEPRTELGCALGLQLDNGIWTDTFGTTSRSNIWACGDCASFPLAGRQVRLESVQNAIDQAECVAANILGAQIAYRPTPTFWSDQWGHTLQSVGLFPHDKMHQTVTRPGKSPDTPSLWHFTGDKLASVEVIDDGRTFAIARRLVSEAKSPTPAEVLDPAVSLKSLLNR